MPAEKSTPLKSSENRRATKPIMEKRRRARINKCLQELKTLILDALNKDPTRHSKLEKADILEMTVRHLQNVQRQQISSAITTDANVLNKFKAGFNECASEVNRYIGGAEAQDPALRRRLLSHLSHCLSNINTIKTPPSPGAFASAASAMSAAFPGIGSSSSSSTSSYSGCAPQSPLKSPSLSVQIPSSESLFSREVSKSDINNNPSAPSLSTSSSNSLNGLSLIPTRLPNGEVYFLLPGQVPSSKEQLFMPPEGHSGGLSRLRHSSWNPKMSPSALTRRSVISPALSESSALSPVGSETGSDVFTEFPNSSSPPLFHPEHRFFGSESSSPNSPSPRMSIDNEPTDLVCKRDPEHLKIEEDEIVWRPW